MKNNNKGGAVCGYDGVKVLDEYYKQFVRSVRKTGIEGWFVWKSKRVVGRRVTREEYVEGLSREVFSKMRSAPSINCRNFKDSPYLRMSGDENTYTHYYDSKCIDECTFTVTKSRRK